MKCPNPECGQEVEDKDNFCDECGTSIIRGAHKEAEKITTDQTEKVQVTCFQPDFRPSGVEISHDLPYPVNPRALNNLSGFLISFLGGIAGVFIADIIGVNPEIGMFIGLFSVFFLVIWWNSSFIDKDKKFEYSTIGIVTHLNPVNSSSKDFTFYLQITDDNWHHIKNRVALNVSSNSDKVEGPSIVEGSKIIMEGYAWPEKSKPIEAEKIWNCG